MIKTVLIDKFISVVLVANQKQEITNECIENLSEVLRENYTNYEIICVTEDSKYVSSKGLNKLLDKLPCLRFIFLTKKDSIDIMVFAGVDSAIGDSVVVMLAGKDPADNLPDFVKENNNFDIVFGISNSRIRKGIINEYGSKLFYWYNQKFLGISIPNRSTYYIAFSRSAINALTRTGRHARHIRYLARQIGYSNTKILYTPESSYGEKKSVKDLFVSAIELSTNYSNHPLRFVSWVGFLIASVNVVYAIYVVLVKLFKSEVAEGWTTTSLQLSIMFFFLFAILAILCEYIGKILEESRKDQPYHIINEYSSKISVADATRRNISK